MTHAIPAQDATLDPKDAFEGSVQHRTYLIDGELRTWKGSVAEVYSPIHTLENGTEVPVHLGSAPDLTKKEGLEALAAARKAYDNGRGAWATCRSSNCSCWSHQ